ncbi:MAG: hypothetical protein WCP34_14665 [Pseudomonadota bacterium]
MLKMVGTSGQLSLGKKYAGKYFEVTEQTDGVIVMMPMSVIPESETWLHTAKMRERLEKATQWMKDNPPSETDLDTFLANIESRRSAQETP